MRVCCAALLTAAITLATADAFSPLTKLTANDDNFAPSLRPHAVDRHNTLARRLRTSQAPADDDNADDGERGIDIPMIDDFVEKMMLNSMRQTLNKAGDDIFANSQWSSWAGLIQKNNLDREVVEALTRRFDDAGVSALLATAAKNPKTNELATKLEVQQLKGWLSHSTSPTTVFKKMELDKANSKLFDSPQLATWTNYLAGYKTNHPKEVISMLDFFTKAYGNKGFVKLLASADDSAGLTKFKEAMLKEWIDGPVHPTNIYRFFQLDKAGDDLLSNPLLSTWVQYMTSFNEKYPFAKTTMIQTFTKSYGEEKLATMIKAATKVSETEQFAKNLQTAQFKQWMAEKKTPDDIFKTVLKLDSPSSPNADIWRAYYNAYDKQYPDKLFSFSP